MILLPQGKAGGLVAATGRSRYCAEQNLIGLFHRYPTVYYWTFTFAENLAEKAEAERRFHPLFDWIRRHEGDCWFCWEHQERGALHLHLVTNLYIDVTWLRPWLVKRGWGPIMKVIKVASPAQFIPGEGWKRECSGERGLIRYLLKYLTKAIRSADKWTKPWGCSKSVRNYVTSFRWVPWVNASCFLYHAGLSIFSEITGRCATFNDIAFVIRLGYEVTGWADVDPWFYI